MSRKSSGGLLVRDWELESVVENQVRSKSQRDNRGAFESGSNRAGRDDVGRG